MEEATAPFKIQNITLFEPLGSRASNEVLSALDRVWVRFRALGIPMVRLHSDRAKEMLSKPVRAWAGRRGLYQTFTSGDDAPSNGRIESEILQFKRRLRLTLQSAAAKVEEWPSVARHSSEERLRAQLQKVGLRQHAMLPYNVRVLVKTKLWHKRFTQGMASPYFQATLKGPSPLMNHGWIVQTDKGLIQHARSVVTTDPNAERAMLELIGDPLRPLHRLVGKQSVGEKVEPPNLMDEAKRAGPDSESAAGRLGVEGEVPGSVPAARGDGEESQYEPSIYMGEDHGERMEEVEDVQPEDIWGDDPDPGEPSALRALHGDGEPLGVPTNLVGGGVQVLFNRKRSFNRAQHKFNIAAEHIKVYSFHI